MFAIDCEMVCKYSIGSVGNISQECGKMVYLSEGRIKSCYVLPKSFPEIFFKLFFFQIDFLACVSLLVVLIIYSSTQISLPSFLRT